MSICRCFIEIDLEDGFTRDWCNGAESPCTSTGCIAGCANPAFYDTPPHRWPEIREREAVDRGVAMCEPYRRRR